MELITKQTGEGLIFLVLMFLAIGAAKLLSHWRLRHVYSASHEIVEHSHLAIGLRQAGMFLGIGIGMIGTIGGPSKGSMLLDV
ncbi:MAG TPA: hypothetical protein VLB83_04160, partial [Candidatus Paceibacterota bacterium]|nr:hypothetical protein [Candidatus Paceibacterota bacterium]